MQFRLRTLMIVLAIGPPMLAVMVMLGLAARDIVQVIDIDEFLAAAVIFFSIPVGLACLLVHVANALIPTTPRKEE